MANGTIDLECGSTTNNLERQKQVAFTITHFVTANRFVSKKSANLQTVDDLKGKTVVSTSGTTNIKQITEIGAQKGLNLNILAAKDHAEAFLMVETGRAAAFVMDDILLSAWWRRRSRRRTTPSPTMRCRSSPTASCCGATTPRSRRWSMKP